MMLDRSELATAISAMLVGAILFGWFLHWLWYRLSKTRLEASSRLSEMAGKLQDAEASETEAIEARQAAEGQLAAREAELQAEIEALQNRLNQVVAARDAELASQLRETKAELEATMEGLGFARARIAELEAELASLKPEG